MSKILYLLPLSTFFTLTAAPLYAEGEDEDVVYEEVVEEEAVDASEEASLDPATRQGDTNDITTLRAEMASLTQKIQKLESTLKHSDGSNSHIASSPGGVIPIAGPSKEAITDPEVLDLMKEIGATTMDEAKKTLEASNKDEVAALAHARNKTGHLPQGKNQSDFDHLHKLYTEAMEEKDPKTLTQKANTFKTACGQYIQSHQTDSSSRSALYYLGSVLLKQNLLKDAQNAFARVYRGDEDGPHGADALLGMCKVLIKQGNKSAAIKFLEKIKKDFKPDYLTDETKTEFKNVVKEAGATLSLDAQAKQAIPVAKKDDASKATPSPAKAAPSKATTIKTQKTATATA